MLAYCLFSNNNINNTKTKSENTFKGASHITFPYQTRPRKILLDSNKILPTIEKIAAFNNTF